MRPYQEVINKDNSRLREFKIDVDDDELKWHKDANNRYVTILEGEGWQFQRDNELPFTLKKGDTIFIAKETYHRVLKGSSNLLINIKEEC
jgi:quercetin dioxygenase-like cupin family protein